MRRIILVARRAKVDGFVSNTNFKFLPGLELFARMAVLILFSATDSVAGIRRTVFVSLVCLKPNLPTPAKIAFTFASVAHEHTAIVKDSFDAICHHNDRI